MALEKSRVYRGVVDQFQELETRILVVDAHPIVREGYKRVFDRRHKYQIVAEATALRDAFKAYCEYRPDIVIADVELSGSSGIDLIRRIRQHEPPFARTVLVTMCKDVLIAKTALEAGARAYMSKTATSVELLDAIARVICGEIVLDETVAEALGLGRFTEKVRF